MSIPYEIGKDIVLRYFDQKGKEPKLDVQIKNFLFKDGFLTLDMILTNLSEAPFSVTGIQLDGKDFLIFSSVDGDRRMRKGRQMVQEYMADSVELFISENDSLDLCNVPLFSLTEYLTPGKSERGISAFRYESNWQQGELTFWVSGMKEPLKSLTIAKPTT